MRNEIKNLKEENNNLKTENLELQKKIEQLELELTKSNEEISKHKDCSFNDQSKIHNQSNIHNQSKIHNVIDGNKNNDDLIENDQEKEMEVEVISSSYGKNINYYNEDVLIKDVLQNSNSFFNEILFKANFNRYKLIYNTKDQGDNAQNFRKICSNKGPTLTIVSTKVNEDDLIFGGFTRNSWKNDYSDEIKDKDAFLFSIDKETIIEQDNEEKNNSIVNHMYYGPSFGTTDLILYDSCTKNTKSYSSLKNTYGKTDSSIKKYFLTNGARNFKVSSYEVYSLYNYGENIDCRMDCQNCNIY